MICDKDDILVGSAEAAKILGTTQGNLRELSRRNKIPCYKFMSRWKYKVSDLKSFIKANTVTPSDSQES